MKKILALGANGRLPISFRNIGIEAGAFPYTSGKELRNIIIKTNPTDLIAIEQTAPTADQQHQQSPGRWSSSGGGGRQGPGPELDKVIEEEADFSSSDDLSLIHI